MTNPLHVLLLENLPGVGDLAAAELTQAGHEVHRCHDGDGSAFPCRGLEGVDPCPLDGPIDVALLVRRGPEPRPTGHEVGVTCARRGGIPLVEDSAGSMDPFASEVAARVSPVDGVVGTVEHAVDESMAPLERAVERSLAPLLASHGLPDGSVTATARWAGDSLRLHLDAAHELPGQLRGQLCVAAVQRAQGVARRHASIEVGCSVTAPSGTAR